MKINARSYAKINLLLDVGGLRTDGYHELSTIFQTIDLFDELSFTAADQLSLTIDDNSKLAIGAGALTADESNLVMRAARALQKATGNNNGAAIHLNKRIPMGGGLGGGSSNAAVTLLALNRLWQCNLSNDQLAQIGAQIGADVPFFCYGGTAWGSGRGTEIMPIDDVSAPFLLLVNPRESISTKSVFQGYDQLTNHATASTLPTCSFTDFAIPATDATQSGSADRNDFSVRVFDAAKNSLTAVAHQLCPVIASVETSLRTVGGNPVLMSGSGATVWARFATATDLTIACNQLQQQDWLVLPTGALTRAEYWRTLITVVI